MTDQKNIDPEFCTTQDIVEAAGVTTLTVRSWVERGLLPKPAKVSLGYPLGAFLRFPAWALMRARFIVAKRRDGLTLNEIRELIEAEAGVQQKGAVNSERAPRPPARSGRRRR